jgi:citronellyl-CoA dehydrogenase
VARKLKKAGMNAVGHRAAALRRRARAAALAHRRRRHGLHVPDEQFQEERLWAALAGARARHHATPSTTCERQAFGKQLLDNQYMHYKLAELQTEVEALRACLARRWRCT